MRDFTSTFRGVSISIGDLTAEIESRGWQVQSVGIKSGQYSAKIKSPHGQTIEKTGPTDATALSHALIALMRTEYMRTASQQKVGMWKTNFTPHVQEIAQAYAKAPTYDYKAAPAWKELAMDCVSRADALKRQLEVEITVEPEPYDSWEAMAEDIHKKKHISISRAGAEHPIWTVEQVVAFRLVFDVLGHAVSGGQLDWHGVSTAFNAVAPLLSLTAQKALFTEALGYAAYADYFHALGEKKIAFVDEEMEPNLLEQAQATENGPGHAPTHPSQSLAPTQIPKVEASTMRRIAAPIYYHVSSPQQIESIQHRGLVPSQPDLYAQPVGVYLYPTVEAAQSDWGLGPHDLVWEVDTSGLSLIPDPMVKGAVYSTQTIGPERLTPMLDGPRLANAPRQRDPNFEWESGVEPLPNNGYLWQRDPITGKDPLHLSGVMDNAHKLQSDWHAHDRDTAKQAVVNALRAAVLSPMKDTKWSSIHYQNLMHVPASVEDPMRYWKTLDTHRGLWNASVGVDPMVGMPYFEEYQQWRQLVRSLNPEATSKETDALAEKELMHMLSEEEERVLSEAKGKISADDVDRKVERAIKKRLNVATKPNYKPDTDFPDHKLAAEEDGFERSKRYGPFTALSAKQMGQISQHSEKLLKAALDDLHHHGGKGHHFRSEALAEKIKGVGPKTVSHAWLLLQPLTSQLGVIDSHLNEVLGKDPKVEASPREFFKHERELAALRDAAGYGHVPLGAFGWGLRDHRRTGPATHEDLGALRPLDPVPHDRINWDANQPQIVPQGRWQPQSWIADTQLARDQVAKDFDDTVAIDTPKHEVPYKAAAAVLSGVIPYYVGLDGQPVHGQPDQSLMNHLRSSLGISMEDAWALPNEVGKTDGGSLPVVLPAGQAPGDVAGAAHEQENAASDGLGPGVGAGDGQ